MYLVCWYVPIQNNARYRVGMQWTLGYSLGYKHTALVHRLAAKSFKSHKRAYFLSRYKKPYYGLCLKSSGKYFHEEEVVTLGIRMTSSKCLNDVISEIWYCLLPLKFTEGKISQPWHY